MAGIFPEGGVVASQTINADQDAVTVMPQCPPLFYSSRCISRFDPFAMNAVISEIVNAVNCAGLAYDCRRLDNLCLAIKKIATDTLFGCLIQNFPMSSTACSISNLAVETDSEGCSRIVRYSEASAILATATACSVTGVNVTRPVPANPAGLGSYYDGESLAADAEAGTIDQLRLAATHLIHVEFDLTCAATVAIDWTGAILFNPAQNGGNGATAFLYGRLNGQFQVNPSTHRIQAIGVSTNYDAELRITDQFRQFLPAGHHEMDFYWVGASPTYPAVQANASCLSGGADAGCFMNVHIVTS